MEVDIKDRKKEVENFRLACAMAGVVIDYIHADLVLRVQEKINLVNGSFSISDGVDISSKWRSDWDQYFKEKAVNLEDVKSEPLTDEWFLTHGFEVVPEEVEVPGVTLYSHKKYPFFMYFNGTTASVRFWQGNEKKYVHEVQALFHALSGEFLTKK